MNTTDCIAVLPLLVVAASAVVVILFAACYRQPRWALVLTLLGLAVACATLPLAATVVRRQITPLLLLDGYALFYLGLIFAATFAVAILCYGYFGKRERHHEEVYLLLLLAALGAAVLVASSHFAAFFLGLELLSVALFALIAYPVGVRHALEAGIKYLVLAGVSSAFLLFGMALIYAELGTMQFAHISALLATKTYLQDVYWLTGLALMVAGLGFKLAMVPFHLWTPDVYEGAPVPVTAFVATNFQGCRTRASPALFPDDRCLSLCLSYAGVGRGRDSIDPGR